MNKGDQEKIRVFIPAQRVNDDVRFSPYKVNIRMAKFQTDNIIKNEERAIGIGKYDILMGTYTAEWTPTFRNFCQINKTGTPQPKGKFKVLLKFDEFTATWNVVTWDFSLANEEFATQNVDQQVNRLLH